MCHRNSLAALPTPGNHSVKRDSGLKYWQYGAGSNQRLAIITDIYGCNEFYQSFATHFAQQGWTVDLIDLFSDLGELPEITREAAFERRHKLSDAEICNKLEAFIDEQSIDAVIGFCLGGNYVFEMSRRNVDVRLVAYYPFPAGLVNQDVIPTPLEYLDAVTQPVTALVGDCDDSAGRDSMAGLAEISIGNPALDVKVYAGSGHGFLAHLDSEDEVLRSNAEQSLAACTQAIATGETSHDYE